MTNLDHMGLEPITAIDVVNEADLATRPVMDRLSKGEVLLHERGYHAYSTGLNNMRVKIERALGELVDELGLS